MLLSDGPFGSIPSSANTGPQQYRIWDYSSSIPAAGIGAGVCGLLTLLHAIRLVNNHTDFCIPFVIGGILETIGYATRAAAHSKTNSLTPYIVQSQLILLAPIFFAASIYAILGRLIRRVNGDDISIVHPSIMARFFVFGDVLCFLIQSVGGGMLAHAKTQGAIDFGNTVVLIGLAVQIYMFCFFVKIAVSFHRDLLQYPGVMERCEDLPWRRYLVLLYVACACVGMRNMYRLVEYAIGKGGYLMVEEWPLYVGDFAPMAVTLIVSLSWYNPDITSEKDRGRYVGVGWDLARVENPHSGSDRMHEMDDCTFQGDQENYSAHKG